MSQIINSCLNISRVHRSYLSHGVSFFLHVSPRRKYSYHTYVMDSDATSDLNFMEGIMSSLGLRTPLARFMGVAVAVSGVIWFVKATFFFN